MGHHLSGMHPPMDEDKAIEVAKENFLKFIEREQLSAYDYKLLTLVANHRRSFHGMFDFIGLIRNEYAKY